MPSAPGFVPKFKIQYDVDLTPAERLAAYGLRKAMRIAINRSARVLKSAMIAEANKHRRYGFLASSQRIKVKLYRNKYWLAMAGPGRGFKRVKGRYKRGKKKGQPRVSRPAKYAHLVDEGTSRAKAYPMVKPAERAAVPTFQRQVTDELRREI